MAVKVAVVQAPPLLLDKQGTLARVVDHIGEAASEGASLIVFPEGYPTWIWRLRPGTDMGLTSEIHARLLENAVDLSAEDLQPVREAAAGKGMTVVLGLNEIDSCYSRTTLFNTVVVIGCCGK